MSIIVKAPDLEELIRNRTRGAENAHWYTLDGKPSHTRESKGGRIRSTTIRDARKDNLFPSVTSVLGILAKPGLEKWKERNILAAAWDMRQYAGDFEFWLDAVVSASFAKSKGSMDFGTRYHEMAWNHALGQSMELDADLKPFYPHFTQWFNGNVVKMVEAESVVVHDTGFAGTRDIVFLHRDYPDHVIVGDYKTQDVKKKYGPKAWPEHCLQLAAYGHCTINGNTLPVKTMNIIIDNNAPAPLTEHPWTDEETASAWDDFQCCLKLWQSRKNYKPKGAE